MGSKNLWCAALTFQPQTCHIFLSVSYVCIYSHLTQAAWGVGVSYAVNVQCGHAWVQMQTNTNDKLLQEIKRTKTFLFL